MTIKAHPKKSGRNLTDLIGMLRQQGAALSTEELCKPVDYELAPEPSAGLDIDTYSDPQIAEWDKEDALTSEEQRRFLESLHRPD